MALSLTNIDIIVSGAERPMRVPINILALIDMRTVIACLTAQNALCAFAHPLALPFCFANGFVNTREAGRIRDGRSICVFHRLSVCLFFWG